MHASDSGYQRYLNEWEGSATARCCRSRGSSAFATIMRPPGPGHHGHGGVAHRPRAVLPASRRCGFAPVENGSKWVRPILRRPGEGLRPGAPASSTEDPVEVFKRNIYVHPFHEEDPIGLVKLIGADQVLFGSDFPHPEGLADPLSFVDELDGLPDDDIRKVMGGNLGRLIGWRTPPPSCAAPYCSAMMASNSAAGSRSALAIGLQGHPVERAGKPERRGVVLAHRRPLLPAAGQAAAGEGVPGQRHPARCRPRPQRPRRLAGGHGHETCRAVSNSNTNRCGPGGTASGESTACRSAPTKLWT